jgi:hypothetical protein
MPQSVQRQATCRPEPVPNPNAACDPRQPPHRSNGPSSPASACSARGTPRGHSPRNIRHPVPVCERASSPMRTVALVLVIVPPLNVTSPSLIQTTPPLPCAQPRRTRRRLRPKPPPHRPRASAPTPFVVRPCALLLRCRISPRRRTARRPGPWRSHRRRSRSPAHECNAPHARRRRPPAGPIELSVRRATHHAQHAECVYSQHTLCGVHCVQHAIGPQNRAACSAAGAIRRAPR